MAKLYAGLGWITHELAICRVGLARTRRPRADHRRLEMNVARAADLEPVGEIELTLRESGMWTQIYISESCGFDLLSPNGKAGYGGN